MVGGTATGVYCTDTVRVARSGTSSRARGGNGAAGKRSAEGAKGWVCEDSWRVCCGREERTFCNRVFANRRGSVSFQCSWRRRGGDKSFLGHGFSIWPVLCHATLLSPKCHDNATSQQNVSCYRCFLPKSSATLGVRIEAHAQLMSSQAPLTPLPGAGHQGERGRSHPQSSARRPDSYAQSG